MTKRSENRNHRVAGDPAGHTEDEKVEALPGKLPCRAGHVHACRVIAHGIGGDELNAGALQKPSRFGRFPRDNLLRRVHLAEADEPRFCNTHGSLLRRKVENGILGSRISHVNA